MSKEKQIEEMAKIACVGFREGDCENCKSVGICSSYTISEKLYNAGYRKQSEGEWKWMHGCAGYGIYCTNCQAGWRDSEMVELIAHSHDYCPACGAKMHKDKVDPLGDYKPVGNVKIIKKFVAKGGAE